MIDTALQTCVTETKKPIEAIDARLRELEIEKQNLERAFLTDPSDETIAKITATKTVIAEWRKRRPDAESKHAKALAAVTAAKTATLEREASEERMRSRKALRALIATFAAKVGELEAVRLSILSLTAEDRRKAQQMQARAAAIGVSVSTHEISEGEMMAEVQVGLSRAGIEASALVQWLPTVKEEAALCAAVFQRVGLVPVLLPAQLPYAEQIRRALDGEDVYAETRRTA